MSLRSSIPEGYELFTPRSPETARQALAAAVDRGFPAETVLTVHDGYYVPLGDTPAPEPADSIETTPGTEGDEPTIIAGVPVDDDKVDDMPKAIFQVAAPISVAELDKIIDDHSLAVDKSLKKSDKIEAVNAALAKGE